MRKKKELEDPNDHSEKNEKDVRYHENTNATVKGGVGEGTEDDDKKESRKASNSTGSCVMATTGAAAAAAARATTEGGTIEKSNEQEDKSKKKKLKKKKASSLVRKLSLNRFRSTVEHQEQRHTPEGGDSSKSPSQSSQESTPYHLASSSKVVSDLKQQQILTIDAAGNPNVSLQRQIQSQETVKKGKNGGSSPVSSTLSNQPKSERPLRFGTVTIVQDKLPSVQNTSQLRSQTLLTVSKAEQSDNIAKSSKVEIPKTSTLPYAISRFPERTDVNSDPSQRYKISVKCDAESLLMSESPPVEVRRKLSMLEEKRAIFQKRFYETSHESDSGETVVEVKLHDDSNQSNEGEENESVDKKVQEQTKKRARHISVRKLDTFATFEGNYNDDNSIVGHLSDIQEGNYTECTPAIRADMTSVSSQNNALSVVAGEKREHLYKILVIGELGAGKTSIIKRYVHQFFSQHYRATIGVDFALKVLNWDPHTIIRLQLWDIAGQERFGNMTRVYYKEAVGAFIVFDVTRSATLDAVVKWKQDLDSKVQLADGSPIPCILLANKCDQQKEGLVNTPAKMDEYCKEKNFAGWFETSAKENINIEEAARFLVNKILQNDQIMKGNGSQDQTDGERFNLNQVPTGSKKSCSC
ncbi:uncharacterized protein [Prorops nasuta]|uniref:uncharacterized protein isoform X2 n=1 Tax=Prorops nasuta TaxID=863751 RepID=UPI0034CEBF3E